METGSSDSAAHTSRTAGPGADGLGLATILSMTLFSVLMIGFWVLTILSFLGSFIVSVVLTLLVSVPAWIILRRRHQQRLQVLRAQQLDAHRAPEA